MLRRGYHPQEEAPGKAEARQAPLKNGGKRRNPARSLYGSPAPGGGMTVPSRPSLWRDMKRWLPGVLISLVALIVVFNFVKWDELSGAWATAAQPLNILAAVLLSIISILIRALLWKTLLKGQTTFKNSFFII